VAVDCVFLRHAGSTIARGFTSYHMDDFDITPYQNAEFRCGGRLLFAKLPLRSYMQGGAALAPVNMQSNSHHLHAA